MNSFSSLVKEYLCEKSLEELGVGENSRVKWKKCCAKAFLRCVFSNLAKEEGDSDVLSSDRQAFLEVVAYLLINTFDLEAAVLPRTRGNRKGAILSLPAGTRRRILEQTEKILEEGCDRCRVLYARAAFLSHGTILDPEKGYHASCLAAGKAEAEELMRVWNDFGVFPKMTKTQRGYLLYFKEGSKIEDLLSVMGAQKFSLDLMNQRIDKSLRGNINRRLNFDGANLKKTVNSSQNVIAAITYLEQEEILSTLSEHLQKAAKLRLSYPEVSLAELVQHSEERITKSGLNHRLQKLVQIAETIQKEREES